MKTLKLSYLIIHLLIASILVFSCELNDFEEPGNLVPKTVDEDPLLPRLEVNGTTLHAEAFGDISNPIKMHLAIPTRELLPMED